MPRRGDQRLLHGVLAGVEPAVPAHEQDEDLRREFTQQVLGGAVEFHSSGAADMTWRTSMGIFKGTPAGPGAAEARAAIW